MERLMVPGQQEEAGDKYTASIELSNACREFYKSRLEAAEEWRLRWGQSSPVSSSSSSSLSSTDSLGSSGSSPPSRPKSSIDSAMEKLRTEMASLMDQDLSLMKQLLTLNETIEDLKWQRKYYYSKGDLLATSGDLEGSSDWSVSDTEMYESESEPTGKYPSPSSLSLQSSLASTDNGDFSDSEAPAKTSSRDSSSRSRSQQQQSKFSWKFSFPSRFSTSSSKSSSGKSSKPSSTSSSYGKTSSSENGKRLVDTQILINGSSYKVYHGEQNSFDSGIHEPTCDVEIRV